MDTRRQKAEAVARKYMAVDAVLKELGSGAEGFIFATDRATAVKVFQYEEKYRRELAAYRRLLSRGVSEILGFAIPRLVNYRHELLVIEMTMVQPPFLLDFAQAFLDRPMEMEEGQEAEWWERVRDNFGADFEIARDVFFALQRDTGIYYYDLAPRNLRFRQ